MRYSQPIKILHALFALGITLQLLLSNVMRQPRPGRLRTAWEALTFTVHQYVGLALLLVLIAHWLLHLVGQLPKGPLHFFPWFSRERIGRLKAEAKEFFRLKLGDPETQDAIAGAIQGLGLVIATLLAITGSLIFFGMADDGAMSATTRAIRRVHTTLAPLMWGYLGIHIAATLVHLIAGHRSVFAIFRLRGD
ncbi:MAG: cytochrome b/b6 domain-containing protein [Betaproteobacteria bacterium]